jgi:hypothetical protein
MRRHKILTVNLEILLAAICRDDRGRLKIIEAMGFPTEGWEPPFVTCDGMPEDARIIDVRPNCLFTGSVDLLIESDTFPDVPVGCELAHMSVTTGQFSSYRTYLELTEKAKVILPGPDTAGTIKGLTNFEPAPTAEYPGEAAKPVAFREFI